MYIHLTFLQQLWLKTHPAPPTISHLCIFLSVHLLLFSSLVLCFSPAASNAVLVILLWLFLYLSPRGKGMGRRTFFNVHSYKVLCSSRRQLLHRVFPRFSFFSLSLLLFHPFFNLQHTAEFTYNYEHVTRLISCREPFSSSSLVLSLSLSLPLRVTEFLSFSLIR